MQRAFGDEQVTPLRIQICLAVFETDYLNATDVQATKYFNGEETTLSTKAQDGAELFKANCLVCHPAPLYTTGKFANTGVEVLYGNVNNPDILVERTTGDPAHRYAVRIPSLIGVSMRRPYTH